MLAAEKIWSGRRDSNPRPRPWQGRALPLSYTRVFNHLATNQQLAAGSQKLQGRSCSSPRKAFQRIFAAVPGAEIRPSLKYWSGSRRPYHSWSIAGGAPAPANLGRRSYPARVDIAKTTIAGQHVRPACLDRVVLTVFVDIACPDIDKRAPRALGGVRRRRLKRRYGGNDRSNR